MAGARAASGWWPALAGALGLGLVATLWTLWPRPVPAPAAPMRLGVALGADVALVKSLDGGRAVALSPDGATFTFVGRKAPRALQQLYLRRLEGLQSSPLAGTEGARSPFFSPDGQWIAFFAEGNLKKVAVDGGAAVTLCGVQEDRGGSWGEDGTIVFGSGGAAGGGLWRVSPAGGRPEVLTKPDPGAGEVSHSSPQVLPGGGTVIYTTSHTTGSHEDATIVAQALPRGPKKVLVRGGYHGRCLPSSHLVYMHDGTLFAAAFDMGRMEMTGEPAPAVEGVTSSSLTGGALFAHSDRGAFVYVPGVSPNAEFAIHWVDTAGKMEPLRDLPGDYADLRFSPDGRRLAMEVRDRNQGDIWVYDWAPDTLSRLTFDPGEDMQPVWTPDGRRIAFASERADKGTRNLYWQRADGTGDAERLTVSNSRQWPGSWHPSGKFLAFSEIGRDRNRPDLMLLPMEGSEASGWKPGTPTVFLSTPSVENNPAFSPDGRWLAHMSRESGRFEVYVRPFPGPGGKWQVSTEGGNDPKWSRTRHQLFYLGLDQRIMVASYVVDGDSFRAEKPRPWSEAPLAVRTDAPWAFDLHPDGQRFAVVGAPQGQSEVEQDGVVFILNFFDYLRRIAPPKGSR